MKQPSVQPQGPSCILVATDLSCRCDRALDRAVQAARRRDARLVVLTVLDPLSAAARERRSYAPSWWQLPNLRAVTERRLRDDLPSDVRASVRVEEGPVVESILAVAAAEGCGLIVTGIARDETFGRLVLGTTVDALVRRATVPVLVVRARPRAPYHRVTVATDFSAPSRSALETALGLFPDGKISVFHAFDAPYVGMSGGDRSAALPAHRASAAERCEAFLDGADLPPEARGRLRVVLEYGPPGRVLLEYVADSEGDLIVLGAHGRPPLLDLFLGSVAKQVLDEADTDVLVVRERPVTDA
ncbi:MAG: universal stress protein [Deltaproteobacteria bacterium]|nr:universal stress protein [Myxococcales bacterium]MDP3214152.1 universal stress protein [Deltaproteobacteria bacterium]